MLAGVGVVASSWVVEEARGRLCALSASDWLGEGGITSTFGPNMSDEREFLLLLSTVWCSSGRWETVLATLLLLMSLVGERLRVVSELARP